MGRHGGGSKRQQRALGDTGALPRIGDTGSIPRVGDTGSIPRVGDTGGLPRIPAQRDAGTGATRRVSLPPQDFGLITHAAAYPVDEARAGHPDTEAAPRRPSAPSAHPEQGRPRADFVDAFEEGVYGAAPPSGEDGDWADWPAGLREPPARGSAGGGAHRKRNRGRYATCIAAAVTAAAVGAVIAAQSLGGGKDDGRAQAEARAQTERATRSQPRQEPQQEAEQKAVAPAKPTYAEAMGQKYPLSAELSGPDKFDVAGAPAKAPGKGTVVRYRVDVERGLSLDGELFASAVHKTLNDRRSWGGGGARSFERVGAGAKAAFVITLASPGTTDKWCAKAGLNTSIQKVSCDAGNTERVMINAYRWARGSETFGDEIHAYRQMLINHEVGHRLGWGHVGCTKDGALAPVMMQQTKTLTTDGRTCRPNPWPYPER